MIIKDSINEFKNKKDLLLISNDILKYLYKNLIDLDKELEYIRDETVHYFLDNYLG
jgi:hypothetical protein